MSNDLKINNSLFYDIKGLIDDTRSAVAQTVNSGLTMLYWNIGKKINDDVLENKRADYGKRIVATLSQQLQNEYGKGFTKSSLTRMCLLNESFSDLKIVATLWQQLSWSHFKLLLPVKNDIEREYYIQMCRIEKWTVRELRKKIDTMTFQRSNISKRPDELASLALKDLSDNNILSPDLVFKSPCFLDFLNLKDNYNENDLETGICRELEKFILELGRGFTFVERQKCMMIDNQDFHLDLLFYHRKLKRLVAVELKLGKFKAAYKGQMELYLKWLERYEMEEGEKTPIGLILCAEGNNEQIELLNLEEANIKVAEYITEFLPKDLLQRKLHQFYKENKQLIDSRIND